MVGPRDFRAGCPWFFGGQAPKKKVFLVISLYNQPKRGCSPETTPSSTDLARANGRQASQTVPPTSNVDRSTPSPAVRWRLARQSTAAMRPPGQRWSAARDFQLAAPSEPPRPLWAAQQGPFDETTAWLPAKPGVLHDKHELWRLLLKRLDGRGVQLLAKSPCQSARLPTWIQECLGQAARHMAVVVKNWATPKWVALVSGNMDQSLQSPGGLILTHTHILARHVGCI